MGYSRVADLLAPTVTREFPAPKAIPGKGGYSMNKYEVGLVISPDMDEENLTSVINKATQWITDGAGLVSKVENWGRRKLAYPIRRFRDGNYIFIYADMEPAKVLDFERNLNLNESVLRHLVIRLDE
jgi:small subunit ribosomal protein S6